MSKGELTLTQNSRVPVSILFGAMVIAFAVGGSWWSIHSDLAELRRQQWSVYDQENWSLRLARDNPSLKVPEPRESLHGGGGLGTAVAKRQ